MSSFEHLADMVSAGDAQLIGVYGIPRSISTALGRSLNECQETSIYVNEPFNRHNRSLDVAALSILGAIEKVKPDGPITVITKNMATYIDDCVFRDIESISKANVWTIRDPEVQMTSLMTRIANDLSVETGADLITQDELEPYLDAVAAFLADSTLSADFSRTGWVALQRLYSQQGDSIPSTVINGTTLTTNPEATLRRLCGIIGVGFSSRMVNSWGDEYTNINVGSSRFTTEDNAWTKDVARADGFHQTHRSPLPLGLLPESVRSHILNVAMPVYDKMRLTAL